MRIAYWSTACLEPRIEAVSKEVLHLASRFPSSWVFSISPHLRLRASWRGRYVGLGNRLALGLRATAPLLERAFDLSHIYGDITPWVYHKSLGARPIIHTVTQDHDSPVVELLERCVEIIVQSDATRDRLLGLGVPDERLHLKLPALDLSRFRPGPGLRRRPARLLFSTAPRAREELETRGVLLLLDAARLATDVTFRLLYRTWATGYTSFEPTREGIRERGLTNVVLTDSVVEDMSREYAEADFTVIPFTTRSGGKECPNSALESLACGVPVLVSSACPFSKFVAREGCGIVFDPTPAALAEAIEAGQKRWPELSVQARRAAEEHLDETRLVEFYRTLYAKHTRTGRPLGMAQSSDRP